MNEHAFKNLVSGKTPGKAAELARFSLSVLEPFYRSVISVRNAAFDLGWRTAQQVSLPVISVGNLTTGGTGKTPVVALIVEMLQGEGRNPAIVSRGYRSAADEANDEKHVLERLCPGVPHAQHSSRFMAVQSVMQNASIDSIVMDDGFQHRQLHRDLDVVLIDATNPFGHSHLLPRGLLREPLTALKRADVVFVTRADMVELSLVKTIEQQIRKVSPHLADRICRVEFRPVGFIDGAGQRSAISAAAGESVMLISGIGNPQAFELSCRRVGLDIKRTRWFPDHHHYSASDLAEIAREATASGADRVVTTLKDLVKLPASSAFVAVEIAAVLPHSEHLHKLNQLLKTVISGQ